MIRIRPRTLVRKPHFSPLVVGATLGLATIAVPVLTHRASVQAQAQAGARIFTLNVLKNAQLAAVTNGKPQDWTAFEGGFELATGAAREGRNAALLQRGAATDPARGISQNVVLDQKEIAPVRISAWSKAENVSGEADNDYAVYADLTFQDGTNQWGLFAAVPTGTHDWQQAELVIQPEKPIKSLTVYGLFRNHTGKAWFSDFSVGIQASSAASAKPIETTAPNLLVNPLFAELQAGKPLNWAAFQGGFDLAAGAAKDGSNAVSMQRAEGDEARGISQNIVLDQKKPAGIMLGGWSKAENVSGLPDNNYALYADILYQDGTNEWGINVPFPTGTHDWQQAGIVFDPPKPVKSLTFYALFREHTGKVWFSNLSVNPAEKQPASPPTNTRNAAKTEQPQKLAQVVAEKPFASKPFTGPISPAGAHMTMAAGEMPNMLANPGFTAASGAPAGSPATRWVAWGEGYSLQPTGGRDGKAAAFIERKATDKERGLQQEIVLNQQVAAPLRLSGWSRAEGVDGAPDSDYSLYSDVVYADGTSLWGLAAEFRTGTHGWEKAEVFIEPAKPIKSLVVYALFRNHTGRVWFSDLKLESVSAPNGAALFDTLAVRVNAPKAATTATAAYKTQDGLGLKLKPGSWQINSLQIDGKELASSTVPSGFLVRDVANASGFYGFENGAAAPLQVALSTKVESAANHISFTGKLSDKSGRDRAISLAFALPIDARGWTWNKDIRSNQTIGAGEYSNTASFFAGANGRNSIYPLASISGPNGGLTLAIDMNHAAQYRIAYNGATKQFYIIYDFGLAPEKSSADFRFIIYRTDSAWGFRSATAKLQQIFPKMFEVPAAAKKQGLWMPFTDISKVQGYQDFGFRFREAEASAATDSSLGFDDKNDFLTLRYSEPMTWWMVMPTATPRTYENAIAQLQQMANDRENPLQPSAQAVLTSGMRDESGRYAVKFLDMPWANGAVWSLNPSPKIQGPSTGASLLWNPQIKTKIYDENKAGTVDGEYLDSLEGYVTANLNFDRAHWKDAIAPLTFSTGSRVPAQHKGLLAYEYTRWVSGQMHGMNKLLMANSVPYRFSYLTPWLDVMGTEADWNPGGQWRPDDDALMNLRRTMSGAKPYLLLQNTNYKQFSSQLVEKYMQRCLFYGIFPGFFSHDAASDPYWLNPAMYNRDRGLFKKYVPLVKQVAEAGWQPLTYAKSKNPKLWLERFGSGKEQYLTVRNDATARQGAAIELSSQINNFRTAVDLVSGAKFPITNGQMVINLMPEQTMALRLD